MSTQSYTSTGPFNLSSNSRVTAAAKKTGYINSDITSANYSSTAIPAIVFSTGVGNPVVIPHLGSLVVTFTIPDLGLLDYTAITAAGISIYYNLNGASPVTQANTLYTGPLTLTTTTVIRAYAVQTSSSPRQDSAETDEKFISTDDILFSFD